MRFSPEVKVGLIVLIAILALVSMYMYVGGRVVRGRTYVLYATFDDVQRLDVGSFVRMAGVRIGIVSDIQLQGRRALVTMSISRSDRVPKGSKASVTSGTLVGDTYVEILPGPSTAPAVGPGSFLEPRIRPRFEDVMPKVDAVLTEIQKVVRSVNVVLGDPKTLTRIKETLANVQTATAEAASLMAGMRDLTEDNRRQVDQALASAAAASRELEGLARDMHGFATGSLSKDWQEIAGNAKTASGDLEAAMKSVREMTSGPGREDLETALASVRAASVNLDKASQGIAKIATDEKLSEDMKATVANAREASEQAKELMTTINRKFGGGDKQTPKSKPVNSGLRTEALERVRSSDLRVDLDWTIPWRDRRFYRVGLRDIGESTGVNAQAGMTLGERDGFRYGVYASRVGLGYDYRVGQRSSFELNLYRPNDPDMEFKLRYLPASDWEFVVGMDRGFDDASFLLGVGFRK